jgi:hypothetical protein
LTAGFVEESHAFFQVKAVPLSEKFTHGAIAPGRQAGSFSFNLFDLFIDHVAGYQSNYQGTGQASHLMEMEVTKPV